jgi:hypothetical protein
MKTNNEKRKEKDGEQGKCYSSQRKVSKLSVLALCALIKKKRKFSSYIRNSEGSSCQVTYDFATDPI